MKSRLLLNVVIRQSSAIFELLSCEDQSLLVGGLQGYHKKERKKKKKKNVSQFDTSFVCVSSAFQWWIGIGDEWMKWMDGSVMP